MGSNRFVLSKYKDQAIINSINFMENQRTQIHLLRPKEPLPLSPSPSHKLTNSTPSPRHPPTFSLCLSLKPPQNSQMLDPSTLHSPPIPQHPYRRNPKCNPPPANIRRELFVGRPSLLGSIRILHSNWLSCASFFELQGFFAINNHHL